MRGWFSSSILLLSLLDLLSDSDQIDIRIFDDEVSHAVFVVFGRCLDTRTSGGDLLIVGVAVIAEDIDAPLTDLALVRGRRTREVDLNVAILHACVVTEPEPFREAQDGGVVVKGRFQV